MPSVDDRLADLRTRLAALTKAAEAAAAAEGQAKSAVDDAETAVGAKEEALTAAEAAVEKFAATKSSALAERARIRSRVEASEAEVAQLKDRLRKCGGVVDGEEVDVTDSGNSAGGSGGGGSSSSSSSASSSSTESALRKLSDRDLNEVRKLHKPPNAVRRALELVQTMLLIAEGNPWPAPIELSWDALVRMLTKEDFIKRVLALKPLPLSLQPPALLEQIAARWPSLKDAVGTKPLSSRPASSAAASSSRTAVVALAAARAAAAASGGSGRCAAAAAAAEGVVQGPTRRRRCRRSLPRPSVWDGSGSGGRFEEAVHAALAEAKPEGAALTVEAVEYASKPCGAIFRYCANCASGDAHGRRAGGGARAARRGAQAPRRPHRRNGSDGGVRQGADGRGARLDAPGRAPPARSRRRPTRARPGSATRGEKALEAARRAVAEAEERLRGEEELAERQREQSERYKAHKATREREAELARIAELERHAEEAKGKRPPKGALVWVREHELPPEVCSSVAIEFGVVGSATLPPSAASVLSRLALELQAQPEAERGANDADAADAGGAPAEVKLHIAGHVQADEAPRLASQRAQAVGGALIALGVSPLRLRAKGYGAAVPLSRGAKAALRLKSARRVTLHAISEVCIAREHGVEFEAGATEFEDEEGATAILRALADLMAKRPRMALSVEAHTDAEEGRHLLAAAAAAAAAAAIHGRRGLDTGTAVRVRRRRRDGSALGGARAGRHPPARGVWRRRRVEAPRPARLRRRLPACRQRHRRRTAAQPPRRLPSHSGRRRRRGRGRGTRHRCRAGYWERLRRGAGAQGVWSLRKVRYDY